MNRSYLRILSLALSALLAASCSASDSAPPAGSDISDLTGGTEAVAGQFPSTLLIWSNCTVSKVGPRHILTAAHCVFDNNNQTISPSFADGAELYLSNKIKADSQNWPGTDFLKVTIKTTHLHPAWREVNTTSVRVLTAQAPADVAIVELTESSAEVIASIPEASIDLTPVAPGDALILQGYGCEEGVYGAKDYAAVRLKYQKTKAIGISEVVHPGSFVTDTKDVWAQNLAAGYVFTPGKNKDASEASLCPGDSGGPVYRHREGQTPNVIVGVNAYYTFKPCSEDPLATSVTNWHTRLDGSSHYDIGGWLASLGVKYQGGTPSAHYNNCETSTVSGRQVCGVFLQAWKADSAAIGEPDTEARLDRDDNGNSVWMQKFAKKIMVLTKKEGGGEEVVLSDRPEADPCFYVAVDGSYCADYLGLTGADASSLIRCEAHKTGSKQVCAGGCRWISTQKESLPEAALCAPDPQTDPCAKATSGSGYYCASSLGSPALDELLYCYQKKTFAVISCVAGCAVQASGVPDRCQFTCVPSAEQL